MKDSVTAEGGNYGNAELSPGTPAPGVYVFTTMCVHFGWVKGRAQIQTFHVTFTFFNQPHGPGPPKCDVTLR